MAVLFQWEGTYDDTTDSLGNDISGTNLSAGGGDAGSDTTVINADSDRMDITGLGNVSNVIQQSGVDILDLNQGTILLRLSLDNASTNNYNLFGFYTASDVDYFYVTFLGGSSRLYLYAQDDQGPDNQASGYLTWSPSTSTFYDIRITWDMDVNSSIKFSIDGNAFAQTAGSGNESSVVLSDINTTNLAIGNRGVYTAYRGEVSRCLISDVYEDLTLGEGGGGIMLPIFNYYGINGLIFGGQIIK